MRINFKLKCIGNQNISINYNHSLMAAIYDLLRMGSKDFAQFLHFKGFNINGQVFKLFTFALKFEKSHFLNNCLHLDIPKANLIVSSPRIEDFVKNFLIGTFTKQKIEIYSEYIKTNFIIDQAELMPEPDLCESNYFHLATPLVLSKREFVNGKVMKYYFRYEDNIDEINNVLRNNLIKKYEIIYNRTYNGTGVNIKWDEDYIKYALNNNKKLSKKVSIMKDPHDPINIKAIFCPFTINGDKELIKVGYDCGFGENNSLGFGMVYKNSN